MYLGDWSGRVYLAVAVLALAWLFATGRYRLGCFLVLVGGLGLFVMEITLYLAMLKQVFHNDNPKLDYWGFFRSACWVWFLIVMPGVIVGTALRWVKRKH